MRYRSLGGRRGCDRLTSSCFSRRSISRSWRERPGSCVPKSRGRASPSLAAESEGRCIETASDQTRETTGRSDSGIDHSRECSDSPLLRAIRTPPFLQFSLKFIRRHCSAPFPNTLYSEHFYNARQKLMVLGNMIVGIGTDIVKSGSDRKNDCRSRRSFSSSFTPSNCSL